MNDRDCVEFLQWVLPQLDLRWPGYRKVRGQVCKRIGRRIRELALAGPAEYRSHLESNPREWDVLRGCCRITISRFYRDRGVFEFLSNSVLPALARQAISNKQDRVRILSVGCSSGEEPYSLLLLWTHRLEPVHSELSLKTVAIDVDPQMIERARQGRYQFSSLREIPDPITDSSFDREGDEFVLSEKVRKQVRFECLDVREGVPAGPWDLILCRNLVFTYFVAREQERIARALVDCLRSDGGLVLGAHEQLPAEVPGLSIWSSENRVYRKI